MIVGLIIGSARPSSESGRIGHIIEALLAKFSQVTEIDIFALSDLSVPLWQEDKWNQDSQMAKDWRPISERLARADCFVVITPEWAGMATPHLKNFLLMCDKGELAHKPALAISVSSGMGGAYPIAELRSSGYKNSYIWWMPDHIILRNVGTLFHEDDDLSRSLEKRIMYCLTVLCASSQALAPVRESCQNLKDYPFGM